MIKKDKYIKIGQMWLEGKSAQEIATELNTSRQTIYTYVRRLRDQGAELPYRNSSGNMKEAVEQINEISPSKTNEA
jgi:transposase